MPFDFADATQADERSDPFYSPRPAAGMVGAAWTNPLTLQDVKDLGNKERTPMKTTSFNLKSKCDWDSLLTM
jgi:hypothetical protein